MAECRALSPDGTRLATGHSDGKVVIWDPRTGLELVVLKGNSDAGVHKVAFLDDGDILVAVQSQTLNVWRAANFEETDRRSVGSPLP